MEPSDLVHGLTFVPSPENAVKLVLLFSLFPVETRALPHNSLFTRFTPSVLRLPVFMAIILAIFVSDLISFVAQVYLFCRANIMLVISVLVLGTPPVPLKIGARFGLKLLAFTRFFP